MLTLTQIIQIVGFAILTIGLYIFINGAVNMVATTKARRIQGTIVDCVQEYTARGFIWKVRVEYILDGVTNFYITKARTSRRSSGPISIYINKRGRIIERENAIWNITFGLFMIVVATIVLIIAGQQL